MRNPAVDYAEIVSKQLPFIGFSPLLLDAAAQTYTYEPFSRRNDLESPVQPEKVATAFTDTTDSEAIIEEYVTQTNLGIDRPSIAAYAKNYGLPIERVVLIDRQEVIRLSEQDIFHYISSRLLGLGISEHGFSDPVSSIAFIQVDRTQESSVYRKWIEKHIIHEATHLRNSTKFNIVLHEAGPSIVANGSLFNKIKSSGPYSERFVGVFFDEAAAEVHAQNYYSSVGYEDPDLEIAETDTYISSSSFAHPNRNNKNFCASLWAFGVIKELEQRNPGVTNALLQATESPEAYRKFVQMINQASPGLYQQLRDANIAQMEKPHSMGHSLLAGLGIARLALTGSYE